jgi:hypothetical protein
VAGAARSASRYLTYLRWTGGSRQPDDSGAARQARLDAERAACPSRRREAATEFVTHDAGGPRGARAPRQQEPGSRYREVRPTFRLDPRLCRWVLGRFPIVYVVSRGHRVVVVSRGHGAPGDKGFLPGRRLDCRWCDLATGRRVPEPLRVDRPSCVASATKSGRPKGQRSCRSGPRFDNLISFDWTLDAIRRTIQV